MKKKLVLKAPKILMSISLESWVFAGFNNSCRFRGKKILTLSFRSEILRRLEFRIKKACNIMSQILFVPFN